jgi:membrane protein implicated in regulation of membrane protease activity
METFFFLCAVAGGTVFVLQFVLAVVGFGADDLDFGGDMPDDIPDDIPDDLSGDLGDAHGSTWLFGVISFRTVVAALLFFGLAGMGSLSAELSWQVALLIAIVAGAAAMYGVHYLMQALYRQRYDGTVRIERTVGRRGTVYVPIPANHTGMGKIQIRTQGRIMEYAAKTAAPERLKTGTTVEVVGVLSPMTVEVEPIDDEAGSVGSELPDDEEAIT